MSEDKRKFPINDGLTGSRLIKVPEPGKTVQNGYTGPSMVAVPAPPKPTPPVAPPAQGQGSESK